MYDVPIFSFLCRSGERWIAAESRDDHRTSRPCSYVVSGSGTDDLEETNKKQKKCGTDDEKTKKNKKMYSPVKGDATVAPSEMRRQVPVRRRFGNICLRLGIRVRDLQPRFVFRGCRMVVMQITRILSFLALFWAPRTTYDPSWERSFSSRDMFDDDSPRGMSSAWRTAVF